MPIIGNALLPMFAPSGEELYIIQNGIIQSGYTFAVHAIAYNSAGNVAQSSTVTQQSGYIKVRGAQSGSSRGGSSYSLDTDISSIIGNYAYLYVTCKRIIPSSTNYNNRIGTYDSTISGNYSSAKFLDSINKNGGGSDASAVTLQIPITSATTAKSNVQICFAYTTYVSYTTGVDIYDVWLSNT